MFHHFAITDDMLDQLEKARAKTGFAWTFTLLEEALISEEFNLRRWARLSLESVAEYVRASETRLVKKRIIKFLSPVVATCLSAGNPELQRYALQALEELAQVQSWPSSLVFYVVARLDDEEPRVAAKAANILYDLSQKGINIDTALEKLLKALNHPFRIVRVPASRAISQHLQNVGAEEPIEVHKGISRVPADGRYTSYKIIVSHRRAWAKDDEPFQKRRYKDMSGFPVKPYEYHVCGVCRSESIRLIYGHDQSDDSWREFLHEYLCEACRKYTVYEFFD